MKLIFVGISAFTIATVGVSPTLTSPTPVMARAADETGCTARLTAKDPFAQINVRTGPGTQYPSPHYGVVGDTVIILRGKVDGFAIATDSYGYRWVKVRFPNSGATGWIRRDLVSGFTC